MFYDKKELQSGIKHEMEHTKDKALATKIAVDHLIEDPKYYEKLNASGLEETTDEGAMTPLEAGYVEECGDMGDMAMITPIVPNVAVVKIAVSNDEQNKLSSSGLGKTGTPKPLKSDNLEAPQEKAKVGANKVAVTKTAPIGMQADPMDHFGSQIMRRF